MAGVPAYNNNKPTPNTRPAASTPAANSSTGKPTSAMKQKSNRVQFQKGAFRGLGLSASQKQAAKKSVRATLRSSGGTSVNLEAVKGLNTGRVKVAGGIKTSTKSQGKKSPKSYGQTSAKKR